VADMVVSEGIPEMAHCGARDALSVRFT